MEHQPMVEWEKHVALQVLQTSKTTHVVQVLVVSVKELIVLQHPTPTSLFASVGFNAVTVVVNSVMMETGTLAQF
jgi:hypothetical protein